MHTSRFHRAPLAVALLVSTSLAAFAQAPAGRGAAPAAPAPLSIIQQLAIAKSGAAVPPEVLAAATAARTALATASLTVPANAADIQAKSRDLAAAELALALAQRVELEKIRNVLVPLTPDQVATALGGGAAGGRGGGGGRGGAAATWEAAYNNHDGFISLFDGTTLNGWDGETDVWSINNGAIHSNNTGPANGGTSGQHHIHYVGVGAVMKDFDLKVEFRMEGGNAGVQYRARLESGLHARPYEPARAPQAGRGGGAPGAVAAAPAAGAALPGGAAAPAAAPAGGGRGAAAPQRNVAAAIADPMGKDLPPNLHSMKDVWAAGLLPEGTGAEGVGNPWQISGYQFDIYPTVTGNTGSFYEGQGRGVSALPGEVVQFTSTPNPDGTTNSVRTILGRTSELTAPQYYKEGEWNQIEIIARGNTLVHMLNGKVFLVAIDDDVTRRALQGIMSLQLEGNGKVWYRNIWLKDLTVPAPAAAAAPAGGRGAP